MKKILTLLLLLSIGLHAYTYNDALMKIYAKIAPRLALMTKSEDTLPKNTLDICVLYEKGDEVSAKKLQELMLALYPKGLNGQALNITTAYYSEHTDCLQQSLLFLLDTDSITMKPSLDFAKKREVPTISYSNRFLAEGVILSVHLGKTVRPYLNIKAAIENNITLNPLLLQISKIYSEEGKQ